MALGLNDFVAGKSITWAIVPKWQLASLVAICCYTASIKKIWYNANKLFIWKSLHKQTDF
jgi:hypothetical protein